VSVTHVMPLMQVLGSSIHLSGRSPSPVSVTRVMPLMQVLGSSIHLFDLDSHGNFDSRGLLEVCLPQVISRAAIGHLSASGKGSKFGSANPKGEEV
jgi:hypothetical protein